MAEAPVSAFGAPREFAAIDIGSNSVRLVLYRLEGRAIWTVFNEKVLAGLGRDLASTGRLSEDGTAQALTALGRRCAVVGTLGVGEPDALDFTGLTTPDPVTLHAALRHRVGRGQAGEEDMLDMAFEPKQNSRLSCQILVSDELDGLTVSMPSKQG